MLVVALAMLALPALAVAETTYFPDILNGGCKSGWRTDSWSSSEQNRQQIANNGAYTVVYRDAMSVEAGVTCPKLTLNTPGGTYVYTYIDKNGNEQTVTGDLTYNNGVFTLKDMKKGHFGASCGWFSSTCSANLQATFGGPNGLQLMAVQNLLVVCTRTSYYLAPEATAASSCNGCSS